MWAQIVSGVAIMATQMATGIAGGSALLTSLQNLNLVKDVAKFGQVMFIAGTLATLAQTGYQGYNISVQYDSATTSADVTDAKSWLQLIQQMLDETQEELEQIVAKMNDLVSHMFDVINSELETQKTIASEIGQMA